MNDLAAHDRPFWHLAESEHWHTDPLVVLEVDPALLRQAGGEVRLEPGDPSDPGSPPYPHIYGALPVTAVTRTRPAAVEKGWLDLGPWESPDAGGSWQAASP